MATVSVTVNAVNDAPEATDDEVTFAEDTLVTLDVLANDFDVEGDPLSVTAITQPTNGSATLNLDNTITCQRTIYCRRCGAVDYLYSFNIVGVVAGRP